MANFVKAPCDEAVIRSGPTVISCSPDVGIWVLVATILGSTMAFIDGSVVNVALPVLQVDLTTEPSIKAMLDPRIVATRTQIPTSGEQDMTVGMAFIDGSVVNVALPVLQVDLTTEPSIK